jgi:hypothetical protein
LIGAVTFELNPQEDDVKSVCKASLLSLIVLAAGLGPALAQAEAQPERPYSVAQAPGMPGTLCASRSPQVCLGGTYLMVCRCSPNAISGCRWAHTGLRCR